jgi:hypothetical protein
MLDDDADHLLTDDDVDPAPRHGAELPARDPRLATKGGPPALPGWQ